MEQNREPRNRPHLYWNLIYNRNVTADQWGNDGLQENSEEHIYDLQHRISSIRNKDGLLVEEKTDKLNCNKI